MIATLQVLANHLLLQVMIAIRQVVLSRLHYLVPIDTRQVSLIPQAFGILQVPI